MNIAVSHKRIDDVTIYQVESADVGVDMLRKVAERLVDVFVSTIVPENAYLDWDEVRCELWPDSGRMLMFPYKSSLAIRREISLVELTLTPWKELWEKYDEGLVSEDEVTLKSSMIESDVVSVVSDVLVHRVCSSGGRCTLYVYEELRWKC